MLSRKLLGVHRPQVSNLPSSHTTELQAADENSLSWLRNSVFRLFSIKGVKCLNYSEEEQQRPAKIDLGWSGRSKKQKVSFTSQVFCHLLTGCLDTAHCRTPEPGGCPTLRGRDWEGPPKRRLSWSSSTRLVGLSQGAWWSWHQRGAKKEEKSSFLAKKRNVVGGQHAGCVQGPWGPWWE